jgi:hypothetical protein
VDRLARSIRRRIHSALHDEIVAARASAVGDARAAEREVVTAAEHLAAAAGDAAAAGSAAAAGNVAAAVSVADQHAATT